MDLMRKDVETEFLCGLMELGYGLDVEAKLKVLAKKVDWAEGWPEDDRAFWNAEAFMWGYKISKERRKLIEEELSALLGKERMKAGKNLDLGCGAFSYVDGSVGFDVSEKMLQFNDNCAERVVGNLEKRLPFPDGSFASITTVFVMNYVKNFMQLLREVKRILAVRGVFIMVLFSEEINDWQRQKQVSDFDREQWIGILEGCGFSVRVKEEGKLLLFSCETLLNKK